MIWLYVDHQVGPVAVWIYGRSHKGRLVHMWGDWSWAG